MLKRIATNLKNTTNIWWTSGGLEEWSEWAKKMKHSINDSVSLIEEMIKEDENNSSKGLTLE